MATRDPQKNEARYLPDLAEGGVWGIAAMDAGSSSVPPGSPYPPQPSLHPDSYNFRWEGGRVLQEYQIVYLSSGRGVLETKSAGCRALDTGSCFLVFPGEWHRYRPHPATGWVDHWIGFRGNYAAHLMQSFFSPKQPVVSGVERQPMLAACQRLAEIIGRRSSGDRGHAAAEIVTAIALLRAARRRTEPSSAETAIDRAKLHLLAHSAEAIDLPAFAATLGMSYSAFRRDFRRLTGDPPHRYLLKIRLNRAKALMAESSRSVGDVARSLGFSNPEYFARCFRQLTGFSPREFRCQNQPASREEG